MFNDYHKGCETLAQFISSMLGYAKLVFVKGLLLFLRYCNYHYNLNLCLCFRSR